MSETSVSPRSGNVKTALILLGMAVLFFLGFIIRHWNS